jgi:hypothetical protein
VRRWQTRWMRFERSRASGCVTHVMSGLPDESHRHPFLPGGSIFPFGIVKRNECAGKTPIRLGRGLMAWHIALCGGDIHIEPGGHLDCASTGSRATHRSQASRNSTSFSYHRRTIGSNRFQCLCDFKGLTPRRHDGLRLLLLYFRT